MNFDLEYDYAEALKRQGHKQTDVDALRAIVMQHEIIPKSITDKQILLFLDSCGGIDGGAKVMKMYYETRQNSPELFLNRDPQMAKIQQCFENQVYFYLPNTPDGYSVVFTRLSSPKASDYIFEEAIKTYFMTIDSCLQRNGPRPGVIFLFDMKKVGLMHLTRVNLNSIRKFFKYVQECLPGVLKSIHVLNVVSFFDKVLSLIKPFMKAEILQNLFLHKPTNDYQEFFDNYIPKSHMPADYGGDLQSIEELHENHCKEQLRLRDFFLKEELQAGLKLDINEKAGIGLEIMSDAERVRAMTISD